MKTIKISQLKEKRILGRTAFGACINADANTVANTDAETGTDSGNCSDALSAEDIKVTGDGSLALFWAASALEFSVHSSAVWIQLSADYDSKEPWISVYINQSPVSRFMVEKGEPRWFCIANNLNPQKDNLITIYKDTQPMSDDTRHSLFIHQAGLSDDGEFIPLKPRKLKLEFVGDSITSGEGLAGSPDEMEWITQWFAGSKTYAAQTARTLDADFSVVSQCGWGLCWGWDGNRNSKIPPFYEDVCGVMQGDFQKSIGSQLAWDFNGGSDFVIINLGTNDNGAFFQPPWMQSEKGEEYKLTSENGKICKKDAAVIQENAIEFLKKVRRCNPNAKIIWCWGMIPLDLIPPVIKTSVEEYKKTSGDKDVYLLEFDSMNELEKLPEDKGSRGHPGPKTHKIAAQKLVEMIRSLM